MTRIDPFNRLESVSSQGCDWGFYDRHDYDAEAKTADDFCFYGKAGPKCGCDFCREMVARQRDKGSIV